MTTEHDGVAEAQTAFDMPDVVDMTDPSEPPMPLREPGAEDDAAPRSPS